MGASKEILEFLHHHPLSSREEIGLGIEFKGSDATLKREIARLPCLMSRNRGGVISKKGTIYISIFP